ncbi:purple acid phosphatase family protein [Adhaeribacter aerolatus]|nr:metallophosphoesterase family protein [Adhaeribacter aerolatus]
MKLFVLNIFNLLWISAWLLPLPVQAQKPGKTEIKRVNATPGPRPDRIILTWQTDPTTSQTVTWRTDNSVTTPKAEIALADASANFANYAKALPAQTEPLKTQSGEALYHSVNFSSLSPNTLYAYRVGDGTYWSEWFQFRTASQEPEPFSFIYFGDVQNQVLSQWSRVIRAAYAEMPKAKFMLYVGDLINHPEDDTEWQEWFTAGSFIHATIPSILVAGNHEYTRNAVYLPRITRHWAAQFNLPDNGIKSEPDLVYYTDYQDLRIISLNSYWKVPAQAKWLEEILKNNPKKWTVVTCHYPVQSTAIGRENENLLKHWQPILDKYKVDLVLQGHDHTYARGTSSSAKENKEEFKTAPVYVVSISGPKMYTLGNKEWIGRGAENTQLYQIITIEQDKLIYKSITTTGELYDAFELHKQQGEAARVTELKTTNKAERRFTNTLKAPTK